MEQTYRYARPSVLDPAAGLLLATSGGGTAAGPSEHPRFFDGFLGAAEQAATALLVVAKVARTRFYVPPGMLAAILRHADPVVTSNGDRLRFESFSACCGVYARYDVLPGGLDVPPLATGTTNVDLNPPVRAALAGVGGLDPLHLRVGEDLTVTTLDGSVTERKVPLPDRWLTGFAEVQVAGSAMWQVLDVPAVEARRFLRSLPAGSRAPLWAVPAGSGVRLTGRSGPGAACVAAPERLRVLEPLLRFATGLRAYAPEVARPGTPAASAWELVLEDARLVVTLSPDASRGFSGEGGVLDDLAAGESLSDADVVAALLAYEPRIDVPRLAAGAGLPEDRVRRALTALGAAGRVGYDVAEGAFFHRELPYDPAALEALHPRLRGARALAAAGAVRLADGVAYVRGGDVEHVVRGDRCTCPWYAAHQGTRGPCKHVLAARLAGGG